MRRLINVCWLQYGDHSETSSEMENSLGIRGRESFEPYVAITDTDLMERGALVLVFSRIWLLICKFHLRQCWKNHRCKVLKGKLPEQTDLKQRLFRLEDSLIATVICLGCNKDLCSRRSKYKSYGALRGCDLRVRDCLQVYCGK